MFVFMHGAKTVVDSMVIDNDNLFLTLRLYCQKKVLWYSRWHTKNTNNPSL
jgi:hypothetical protein